MTDTRGLDLIQFMFPKMKTSSPQKENAGQSPTPMYELLLAPEWQQNNSTMLNVPFKIC